MDLRGPHFDTIIQNLIQAESGGRHRDVAGNLISSNVGAQGITQVMPRTGENPGYGVTPLQNDSDEEYVRFAKDYLSAMLVKFDGDYKKAVAAYNAGPRNVDKAIAAAGDKWMTALPKVEETVPYVQKVLKGTPHMDTNEPVANAPVVTSTPSSSVPIGDLTKFLLNNAQQQETILKQTFDNLGRIDQTRTAAEAKQKENLEASVGYAAVGAAAKTAVEVSQAQMLENLQRSLGLDQSVQDNIIAANLNKINEADQAYAPARARYDKLSGTSFLDDPLGYIFAQIELPQVAQQVNAIEGQRQEAYGQIHSRLDLLSKGRQQLTANSADAIRVINENATKAAAAKANADLAKIDIEAASRDAAAQMHQVQIYNMLNDNQRQAVTTIYTAEEMAERRKLQNLQLEDLLKKKKLEEQEEAAINSQLKIVSDLLGRQPMTFRELKTLPQKEQLAWMNAAKSGNLGGTLQESIVFFNHAKNAPLLNRTNSSLVMTADKLKQGGLNLEGEATIAMRAANQGKDPPRAEAVNRAFDMYKDLVVNAVASGKSAVDMSSNKFDTMFNPYKPNIQSFNKAIETAPSLAGLKNNIVYKNTSNLLTAGGKIREDLTSDEQQQVFTAITQDIVNNKMSSKEAAAQISEYYKAAAEYNAKMNQYTMFGLPPVQTYYYSIKAPGTRIKTDLLNPSLVENALTDAARRKIASGISMFSPFIGEALQDMGNPALR